jgi:hypothetical protein
MDQHDGATVTRKIGSRYTVTRVLGRGTCGTVWEGVGPEGPVAVKLLREDLAADQTLIARFVQERSVLTSLEHPNVVAVHDLVVDGTDLALVMDLVEGPDLRERLEARGALPPAEAAALAADVAAGLAAAHARGVVHRDVKPENVLIDAQTGAARLTDFGIARLVDGPRRTRATKIVGTPDYLAPEVIEGCLPGPPVDLYALGTVLFELLTGWTPFGGGHPGAVLRRHVTEPVPEVAAIPEALADLLESCLSKAPAARLTAAELAGRLRAAAPGLAGLPALRIPDPRAALDPDAIGGGSARGVPITVGAVPLVRAAATDRADDSRQTHTNLMRPIREPLGASAAVPGRFRTAAVDGAAGDQASGLDSSASRNSRPAGARPASAGRGSRLSAVAAVIAAGLVLAGGYVWWQAHDRAATSIPVSASIGSTVTHRSKAAASVAPARPVGPVGPLSLTAAALLPAAPSPPVGAVRYCVAGSTDYVFLTGTDGTIRYAAAPAGGSFGGWRTLPGFDSSAEAAVVGRADGRVEVYAVSAQTGALQYTVLTAGAWSGWSDLPGVSDLHAAGAPAAVALDADRTEVIVATRDGGLVASAGPDAPNGTWEDWRTVSEAGPVKPGVALTVASDGTLAAYVIRATDLAVLRVVNDGGWEYGYPTGAVGVPEAAYMGNGRPYLFVQTISDDIQVYEPGGSGKDLSGSMNWEYAGVTSYNPPGVLEIPGHGLVLTTTTSDGSVQLYTSPV